MAGLIQNNDPYDVAGTIDFDDFIAKLKLLIEDEELRKKMGEAGKREIINGKFSIKKRNKRLKEIYEETLK